ncbi:MAG: alcohol dehydrogenase catalytic domain-containing protein [Acidobacteria bacterium]|nr:alcohol dehydrogenase catalytic domain-containing protein [Acidobacteriota bacterium]
MPKPEAGLGEVLVRVCATGVTPAELGWYSTTHAKSRISRTRAGPGHESSGVIVAIGENAEGFEIGDEVYGMNDWFADGTAAEFCTTLPQNVVRKPGTLSHEDAASVPIGALTAWQGLIDRARLEYSSGVRTVNANDYPRVSLQGANAGTSCALSNGICGSFVSKRVAA